MTIGDSYGLANRNDSDRTSGVLLPSAVESRPTSSRFRFLDQARTRAFRSRRRLKSVGFDRESSKFRTEDRIPIDNTAENPQITLSTRKSDRSWPYRRSSPTISNNNNIYSTIIIIICPCPSALSPLATTTTNNNNRRSQSTTTNRRQTTKTAEQSKRDVLRRRPTAAPLSSALVRVSSSNGNPPPTAPTGPTEPVTRFSGRDPVGDSRTETEPARDRGHADDETGRRKLRRKRARRHRYRFRPVRRRASAT